jgi:hypothetical protein
MASSPRWRPLDLISWTYHPTAKLAAFHAAARQGGARRRTSERRSHRVVDFAADFDADAPQMIIIP